MTEIVVGDAIPYTRNDGTVVAFEVTPATGYRPAGAAEVLNRVRDAVKAWN